MPAPELALHCSSFEEWMGAKSRNFRSEMRRKRRRIESDGATVALIEDPERIVAAIGSLMGLHRER